MKRLLFSICLFLAAASFSAAELSDAELVRIGHKVWQNECGGTISGLTSWNGGEDFASLGIGHFIWYPAGRRGPFEESFPDLVHFLAGHGRAIPAWMSNACPWPSRAALLAEAHGPRETELRALLADTVPLQARFLAERMERALPKMIAAAAPSQGEKVRRNFMRLAGSASGTFALIDYVNFKGEGTLPTERYQGEGWGLLQVLEGMPENGDPVPAFADSARAVLARRVRNAPPGRHEAQWLPGWQARVERYTKG